MNLSSALTPALPNKFGNINVYRGKLGLQLGAVSNVLQTVSKMLWCICLVVLLWGWLSPLPMVWAANPSHVLQLLDTHLCARCDLRYANLPLLQVAGGNLLAADLEGANLAGGNLAKMIMSRANLRRSNLTNTNFRGAKLVLADFSYAKLKHTDLAQANLENAIFRSALLDGVDLRGSNLRLADFSDARLHNTSLESATLCQTTLPDRSLSNRDCK